MGSLCGDRRRDRWEDINKFCGVAFVVVGESSRFGYRNQRDDHSTASQYRFVTRRVRNSDGQRARRPDYLNVIEAVYVSANVEERGL